MLIVASAARAKVHTAWFHAIHRGLYHALELGFGKASMLFAGLRLNNLLRKGIRHKDGATGLRAIFDMCKTIAAVYHFFDV
jgi:hypothetical protein